MASNQLAYAPARPESDTADERDELRGAVPDSAAGSEPGSESYAAALRSQYRLPSQRGTVARGSTVLGIVAMAAVGGSGLAVAAAPGSVPAADTGPAPISAPDVLPAVAGYSAELPAEADAAAPRTTAQYAVPAADRDRERLPADPGEATADARTAPADPGEALRIRILGQATAQRAAAAQAERESVERAAAREAAARKVREQAATAKAAADAQAKAAAEAAAKAESERLAQLARSYGKPLGSATLTAGFGDTDPWANPHTGQDFSAPTGTPAHAIHSGTVTSAGWAGAYGYRVVLTLDDGTELWYCHLSTMVVTSGRVVTGDTIGRVGATGNVTEPHLHLEVRPGGGDTVDPLAWLSAHDVAV